VASLALPASARVSHKPPGLRALRPGLSLGLDRLRAKRLQIKPAVRSSRIESRILLIRGDKVILDTDLAEFCGIATKRLNEQVKRNAGRFPSDFVFQLTVAEKSEVVANCDHLKKLKFSRALPFVFTEHGTLMAASVLNTHRGP
jgi:hypothetical protein